MRRDEETAREGQGSRDPEPGPIGEGSSARAPEWTAGSAAPRYRMLDLVGTGGMGLVYRAEDTLLGRTVALKFLPPALTPNPRATARFLNEARAASALDHPNICTIYEVGETAEGQLYLAMAYYEGETLKQRLARGPLPVAEALDLALQVARGLAKAHRHEIVHGDVKPANLMLTSEGVVKVLDFGVARRLDQTLSGPLLGTPGYMAPEQARAGTIDARSDVWSLGVVLREMLTGWRPGRGEEEPPLPPDAPPGTEDLLSRMLAEEPADRYPDAEALLADLSALERVAAGTEGRATARPSRRRLLAGAAVLTLLALTAGGVWLSRNVRRPGTAAPEPVQATLTRLTDLPGREWFPSLSPDGNFFVYARKAGDRNRLFLQQVGGGAALDLLPSSLEGDSQPAISPDGHEIAFRSEREGGGIFAMGLMGESVRRVTDFGFNPAWSPDGKEILCATEEIVDTPLIRRHPSQIYRIDLATGQRRLIDTGDAVQPSWSPHGVRIAYWGISSSGQRMIWTVPAEGGEAVQATAGTSVDWNPIWSPDGRHLYFVSDQSGVTNLWRLLIDERSGRVLGSPEPVTTSSQASLLPSLSRDGRQIVYASDDTKTTLEKVAFEPEGGAIAGPAAAIAQTSNLIAALDASRDGRWLVYQTSVPEEDLFVVRPDGTGLRRLTHDPHKDRQPRWSPDGSRIAFYSNRGGQYEIWIIHADGSGLERAAVLPGRRAYHPIWSPDGRWLACDLGENEALIDLARPLAERRPLFLPSAGRGVGFSASSWSADGRWLAGALHQPDGQQAPGVVLYSLAGRGYRRVTASGQAPTWLSDSRHLLYWVGGTLFLFDSRSGVSRQVLTTPSGSDYNDFSLSPDDRVLYLARNTEQGDIWLLTLR
jgi:Tol biopolymer transport system component